MFEIDVLNNPIEQAQKMLKASFTILRGMGARVEGGDPENTVGNARLGSWVGERLLGSFLVHRISHSLSFHSPYARHEIRNLSIDEGRCEGD